VVDIKNDLGEITFRGRGRGVATTDGRMESKNPQKRAQVGIGTLIVFIAMVLVAAIAAGVLIDTAGFLQSQAEQTGERSSQQVTDRVAVISTTGPVSDTYGVHKIDLRIKKAPGSGDIDLSQPTIRYSGPTGASDVTSDDDAWLLSALSGTRPVLSERSDVFSLTLSLGRAPIYDKGLSAGESVTLAIATSDGGTTTVTATVPDPLPDKDAVAL
jgi:flagellin-like protein